MDPRVFTVLSTKTSEISGEWENAGPEYLGREGVFEGLEVRGYGKVHGMGYLNGGTGLASTNPRTLEEVLWKRMFW